MAQIKAHTVKKRSICVGEILIDQSDSHGTDIGCGEPNNGCFTFTEGGEGRWQACKQMCAANQSVSHGL